MSAQKSRLAKSTNNRYTQKLANAKSLRWLWVILGLIIIVGAWWLFTQNAQLSEQRKMETYLRDKYGEEFIVTNYRVEGAGVGVEGDPVADAWPIANSFLRFRVGKDNNYYDQYLSTLWSYEGEGKIKNQQTLNLSERQKIDLSISLLLQPGKTIPYTVPTKPVPSLDAALQKYNSLLSYSITIHDQQSEVQEGIPSNQSLDRAYEFVKYIRNTGTKEANVSYIYDLASPSASSHNNSFIIHVVKENLANISTANDLLKYLKPYTENNR